MKPTTEERGLREEFGSPTSRVIPPQKAKTGLSGPSLTSAAAKICDDPYAVNESADGWEVTRAAAVDTYKCAFSRDGKMMAQWNVVGSHDLHKRPRPRDQFLRCPNLSVGTVSAVAPTRDGFVLANSDGITGIFSAGTAEPRAFANDLSAIRSITVSRDGKLVHWETVAAQWRFGSCSNAAFHPLYSIERR